MFKCHFCSFSFLLTVTQASEQHAHIHHIQLLNLALYSPRFHYLNNTR
jgi:hypothetical protein